LLYAAAVPHDWRRTLARMKLLSRLLRMPLRLMPPGRVVRIVSGELRGWKWISGSATHGCWLGHYESEAQAIFLANIRPGDVVFDIGANVGFYTLLASKLAAHGSVVAFEPLPRNLALLERHLRLNEVCNVRVLPIAVSSQSGTARFAAAHNPAMGGLTDSGDLEVTTASLDALIANGAIPRPSFLKIDVEGAEHDVLTGAAKLLAESGRWELRGSGEVRVAEFRIQKPEFRNQKGSRRLLSAACRADPSARIPCTDAHPILTSDF
jgi:FkbM family methyltransferase